LAHSVLEAEKFHDLTSAFWRTTNHIMV
jgi:hypothetical protein